MILFDAPSKPKSCQTRIDGMAWASRDEDGGSCLEGIETGGRFFRVPATMDAVSPYAMPRPELKRPSLAERGR